MNFLNYIKGLRKGKEAHRIELDAMYDPFLDEAIDGYNFIKGDHVKNITGLQKRVSRRTSSRKVRTMVISITSVAAAIFVVTYFSVFDKSSADYTDSESLYVYISEDYVRKIQMNDNEIKPSVEINNIEDIESTENFNLYIPSEYIEKSDGKTSEKTINAKTIISNINEILEAEEPLNIYIPERYL